MIATQTQDLRGPDVGSGTSPGAPAASRLQAFLLDYAYGAPVSLLVAITGASATEILRLRRSAAARRVRRSYAEILQGWHGRPPREEDWPAPRLLGPRGRRAYEWLPVEQALLASLVGRMTRRQIEAVLTARLQKVTGDPHARRLWPAIQGQINRIGLQAGTDLVGGLTTRQAGEIVGRVSLVHAAIYSGRLATKRLGHRHIIPRDVFDAWLASREEPPAGWIRLGSLRVPLGISSDSKLPEYAALGFIPDVVLVKGIGTARGTWYIDPARARAILDAARNGQPMPWYGKPLPGNVRMMWAKWQRRRHRRCRACAAIWNGPAPKTIAAFEARYTGLTLGQKRHLTLDLSKPMRGSAGWRRRGSVAERMRGAGVTVKAAAVDLQQPTRWIRGWIRVGLLEQGGVVRDALGGEAQRITPIGVARLRAVAAFEAERAESGEWLGVHAGSRHVGVSITTLNKWGAAGEVTTKAGPRGNLFERGSLEARARTYWAWAVQHFTRATPPAWLTSESTR